MNNSGTGTGGRFPGVARNSYAGPGLANVDVRLGREFKITERIRLALIGEAFNVFNFTNFFTVNTVQYNLSGTNLSPVSSFLTPTASNNGLYGARQLQISGRITF